MLISSKRKGKILIKQHHIVYDNQIDMYYFILPNDKELEVLPIQVAQFDFNDIYQRLYWLMLNDPVNFEKIQKENSINKMITKLKEIKD